MHMSIVWSCSLLLIILFQAGQAPSFPEGLFTDKEKKKIEKNTDDLDERIEAYKDASVRIQKSLLKSLSDKEHDIASKQLEAWVSLLSGSIEDIAKNTNLKKNRSKDLMRYEIQVRRAIDELRDYKLRVPYENQDLFERSIDRADAIRGRMVDILFRPEKVSAKKEPR